MRDLLEVFKRLFECIPESERMLKERFMTEYIYIERCMPFKAPEIINDLWSHAQGFLNGEMRAYSDKEWAQKMHRIWADKE